MPGTSMPSMADTRTPLTMQTAIRKLRAADAPCLTASGPSLGPGTRRPRNSSNASWPKDASQFLTPPKR